METNRKNRIGDFFYSENSKKNSLKVCTRCGFKRYPSRFEPSDDVCKVCRWKERSGFG